MIKAYWWRGGPKQGNFGDSLTPQLCERLSGQRIEHAKPHDADIIASGSVLEPWFWKFDSWESYPGYVWGAGRMFGTHPMTLTKAQVAGVRGRLTLDRLEFPNKETVLFGDPGLLCHLFVRQMKKRYVLGLVPHWTEIQHPLIAGLAASSPEVCIIDVSEPVQDVIDRASQCEFVLSSALHGLALADALEIPNRWLRLDTGNEDRAGMPEFKYRDYYSAFGMEDVRHVRLTPQDTVDTLLAQIPPYHRPGLEALQQSLIGAFPFRP